MGILNQIINPEPFDLNSKSKFEKFLILLSVIIFLVGVPWVFYMGHTEKEKTTQAIFQRCLNDGNKDYQCRAFMRKGFFDTE